MKEKKKKNLKGAALYRALAGKADPLRGLTLDEIVSLAREYMGTPYSSYGKLVSYVHMRGKLPPLDIHN